MTAFSLNVWPHTRLNVSVRSTTGIYKQQHAVALLKPFPHSLPSFLPPPRALSSAHALSRHHATYLRTGFSYVVCEIGHTVDRCTCVASWISSSSFCPYGLPGFRASYRCVKRAPLLCTESERTQTRRSKALSSVWSAVLTADDITSSYLLSMY